MYQNSNIDVSSKLPPLHQVFQITPFKSISNNSCWDKFLLSHGLMQNELKHDSLSPQHFIASQKH